jgi:hypothetical protein
MNQHLEEVGRRNGVPAALTRRSKPTTNSNRSVSTTWRIFRPQPACISSF